jgi:2,3-bisphosphoglycerate-dependent phosphoglycerate mutase
MNAADETLPTSPSLTRRRRTFLAPLWLLAWGGILMLLAAVFYWNSATTTTIVLIRHAEKQIGTNDDAPLSPQGEQRATRLAQMFGDAESFGRVKQIYVSDTRRSQQTAAGLAQRLNLKPVILDPKDSPSEVARRVLRENRGGLAIVVGHSNTIPPLVAKLSDADQVPRIGDEEFDTMYVITVPTIGKASVLRLKY